MLLVLAVCAFAGIRPGPRPAAASAHAGGVRTQASAPDNTLYTEPIYSPAGDAIAYAAGVWPALDVWVADADGTDPRRLTTDEATDYQPRWARDGRSIVFASNRSGHYRIFAMGADGRGVRALTPASEYNDDEPDVSPDGATLLFRSDRDGNKEIYAMPIDGGAARRLTDDPEEDGEAVWSPDGRRILFASRREGQAEIFVMDADGGGTRRLTTTPGDGYSRRAEWSPDGGRIAFGSNRDGNDEIYVMMADGTGATNVSRDPAREYFSRWSPDGRRLLFTSNRDRRQNSIYRMNADGSDVTRLVPR